MRGQGRIFQRKGSTAWWIAYYHRGQEVRESAKTPNKRKAETLLKERLRTAGTPEFIGPAAERLTFEDLAGMYLTDYRNNGRRTLSDAERNVTRLGDAFGLDRALDLTTDRIARYAEARLGDGKKPATVNRELTALKRMFSLAIKAGKLASRPHIAMLAEENAREGFLEPADFTTVRTHLPAHLTGPATFAYLTGWRRGEVTSLEWRDVNLAAREIRLRGENSKNKRARVVKLAGELLAVVEQRATERRLDCPLVFHKQGEPIGDFRKSWSTACEAAGFAGILFHDLRRSAIRNMVRAGVPERVAMRISGHRTRSIFDRYDVTSETDLDSAAERTATYVEGRQAEGSKVATLASYRRASEREPGQNPDNGAGAEAEAAAILAVSA